MLCPETNQVLQPIFIYEPKDFTLERDGCHSALLSGISEEVDSAIFRKNENGKLGLAACTCSKPDSNSSR